MSYRTALIRTFTGLAKEWIASELGPRPQSYLMIAMWGTVALSMSSLCAGAIERILNAGLVFAFVVGGKLEIVCILFFVLPFIGVTVSFYRCIDAQYTPHARPLMRLVQSAFLAVAIIILFFAVLCGWFAFDHLTRQHLPGFLDWLDLMILPAAIVLAAADYVFIICDKTKSRSTLWISISALALAGITIVLQISLTNLPSTAPLIPNAVSHMIIDAWRLLKVPAVFALVATRRHRLSMGLIIVLVGSIIGGLIAIVAAYPAYAYTFSRFVPSNLHSVHPHPALAIGGGCIAMFLALSTGPLSILWAQPQSEKARLLVGGLSGMTVGGVLSFLVATPLASIAASAPLFGQANPRIPSIDILFNTALSLNNYCQYILGVHWALLLLGALLGLGTALLVPVQQKPRAQKSGLIAETVIFELLYASGIPLLASLELILSLLVIPHISEAYAYVFRLSSFQPLWRPSWDLTAMAGLLGLAFLMWQALNLAWLRKYSFKSLIFFGEASHNRLTALLLRSNAFLAAALSLLGAAIVYLNKINNAPILQLIVLISLCLGIEGIIAAGRLSRDITPGQGNEEEHPASAGDATAEKPPLTTACGDRRECFQ